MTDPYGDGPEDILGDYWSRRRDVLERGAEILGDRTPQSVRDELEKDDVPDYWTLRRTGLAPRDDLSDTIDEVVEHLGEEIAGAIDEASGEVFSDADPGL